jgi:uncharacterized OsmC-like protein
MVAANMGLGDIGLRVLVEGDLDLRGTLGTPGVPVGFQAIRVEFRVAGSVEPDRLERFRERTERYCVVFQTLAAAPSLTTTWR